MNFSHGSYACKKEAAAIKRRVGWTTPLADGWAIAAGHQGPRDSHRMLKDELGRFTSTPTRRFS